MKALSCSNLGELCREHGISRKTGYKWRERFVARGVERLYDPPQPGFRHQPTGLSITAIGPARILFAPADAGDMLSRR